MVTLKEIRWGAPHSSVVVEIKRSNGKVDEITLASDAPSAFVRKGFKPRDFHVSDKVEIGWNPNHNGMPGGILSKLKLSDGRMFEGIESPGAAAPAAAAAEPVK